MQEHAPAILCERDSLLRVDAEREAELRLERGHHARDAGLRVAELARCCREGTNFCSRNESGTLRCIHGSCQS